MKGVKILLWLFLAYVKGNAAITQCKDYICTPEVQRLRDYLTIRTTLKDDFTPAVDFFRRLAALQNVEITVFNGNPKFPVVVLKWPGLEPERRSIALVTPMDVDPACYEDGWTYPPFSGAIIDNCIIARGAQGTKSITLIQYEVLSRLKKNNITLRRDVYMIITPDPTGITTGISLFSKTDTYRKMNVGFVLGVGAINQNSEIQVSYRTKAKYLIRVDCYGQSIHSARLPNINTTATGVCAKFFTSYAKFREEQYKLSLNSTDFGNYTAVNFLGARSVISFNILPAHVSAYYVFNAAINTSLADIIKLVRGWAQDAGGNLTVSSIYQKGQGLITKTDNSNPYWVAIKEAFEIQNITVRPVASLTVFESILSLVRAGIPAFGFTPYRNTPVLSNSVDEYLPLSAFFEGIRNYYIVLQCIANLTDEQVADDPRIYLEEPEYPHK